MAGIATTLTSWSRGITGLTLPPRVTYTRLGRGATLGRAGDSLQQQRVLRATLELLRADAPLDAVKLDETQD